MRRLLLAAVAVLAAEVAALTSVAILGLAPIEADREPTMAETTVMSFALRKAVARRASRETSSEPPSADDLADGADIYESMCARCHGEPGKTTSPLGSSFYPPAPFFPGRATRWTEPELAWIVKHGIRNTAMGAFGRVLSDDDVRRVAGFLERGRWRVDPLAP